MTNESDFRRPDGVSNGILINTNNEALIAYKRAKKKMASISNLEDQVANLTKIVLELQKRIND